MKQTGLIFIGLLISSLTFGQTIKIQAGTSLSQLDWSFKGINVVPLYDETLIGYSIFAGLDYMDKNNFNLSSNLGLVRKSGKGEIQRLK